MWKRHHEVVNAACQLCVVQVGRGSLIVWIMFCPQRSINKTEVSFDRCVLLSIIRPLLYPSYFLVVMFSSCRIMPTSIVRVNDMKLWFQEQRNPFQDTIGPVPAKCKHHVGYIEYVTDHTKFHAVAPNKYITVMNCYRTCLPIPSTRLVQLIVKCSLTRKRSTNQTGIRF